MYLDSVILICYIDTKRRYSAIGSALIFANIALRTADFGYLLEIWLNGAADIPLTAQHQKKGGTKSVSLGVEIHGMMLTDPSRIASSMQEI